MMASKANVVKRDCEDWVACPVMRETLGSITRVIRVQTGSMDQRD